MMTKWTTIGILSLLTVALVGPMQAQGNSKKAFGVSVDVALEATRTTLVELGYDVVKLDSKDEVLVVHYRRGNMGKGKGKGPMETLVIRRVKQTVVFEEADPELLVKIQVTLKL
jgi:hypothetical protein